MHQYLLYKMNSRVLRRVRKSSNDSEECSRRDYRSSAFFRPELQHIYLGLGSLRVFSYLVSQTIAKTHRRATIAYFK